LLQPKLTLRVSQRQVLTPGLVQMVSVLALNKLELKEMINSEMVENPVLEEVEESSVTLEERSGLEGDRERSAEEVVAENDRVEKDPFDEIDFGSYFQDYLDPGFRTASSFEEHEGPTFDQFLSQRGTLTDHLEWQLGSMNLSPRLRLAADLVVGNLNEDGYLTASDEELTDALMQTRSRARAEPIPFERGLRHRPMGTFSDHGSGPDPAGSEAALQAAHAAEAIAERAAAHGTVEKAVSIIRQLDPIGVGARDLRECLLIQISARHAAAEIAQRKADAAVLETFDAEEAAFDPDDIPREPAQRAVSGPRDIRRHQAGRLDLFAVAEHIAAHHLGLLQKKDMRELTRGCARTPEQVQAAVELIRTLDPRPGQRYNHTETRLIEPDVAFVKRDGTYVVRMNEEDMPQLRLSHAYRRMLREKQTDKDVKEYVKERYKSAIQLLRNIEQRKNTIVRTCEIIVRRQADFLERGEQALRPMMIKEVAEELGVHASTVSRAVANKYVHTSQGVYELRFFFSEGVNGPEGGDLPLVLLKRKVKKLIEDEDSRKPLTDDQLAAELQRQGIQVTRRTVAKYREDLQIPSTHQRRVR
jgi:RNA polymerase sigma-54 factor